MPGSTGITLDADQRKKVISVPARFFWKRLERKVECLRKFIVEKVKPTVISVKVSVMWAESISASTSPRQLGSPAFN